MSNQIEEKRTKRAATTTKLREGAVRVVLRPDSHPFLEKGREVNPLFSKLLATGDQIDFKNQS